MFSTFTKTYTKSQNDEQTVNWTVQSNRHEPSPKEKSKTEMELGIRALDNARQPSLSIDE